MNPTPSRASRYKGTPASCWYHARGRGYIALGCVRQTDSAGRRLQADPPPAQQVIPVIRAAGNRRHLLVPFCRSGAGTEVTALFGAATSGLLPDVEKR